MAESPHHLLAEPIMSHWSLDEALKTYAIPWWGQGYFGVNSAGNATVVAADGASVDLAQLADDLRRRGIAWPVLIRFPHILRHRVDSLLAAFARAKQEYHYQGNYTAVYPIKVNQQRVVVETLHNHGSGRVGLEAGSKPELMVVLGLARAGEIVVCNGYKDSEYIRLALMGRRLGIATHIVIEKLSELALVAAEARELGVAPLLGIRIRLASIGSGKWQNSGGEKAKFGLSASQVLTAVEQLRAAGLLGGLRMIHFHMGSQIANIRDIQHGLREAARFYAELRALGVEIDTFDVGGGLGIDYDGSRSRSDCSINYSLDEYAARIVQSLVAICDEFNLPHPDIITESGRAMTAHHAMLVVPVIDHELVGGDETPMPPGEADPQISHTLWEDYTLLSTLTNDSRALQEIYHDASHSLAEAQAMFQHGVITLAQRAGIEQLYFAICRRLYRALQGGVRHLREIEVELADKLADKYFGNFSLFQSIPDVWGIDQIFPLVPLQRLHEAPDRRIILEDITCDSDGSIERYVVDGGVDSALPAHSLRPDEPYLLGIFLVGAYQEILGDLHNLFGDTDAVDVELNAEGGYRISAVEHGDQIDGVLRYVHFDPQQLVASYRSLIAAAGLDRATASRYLTVLEAGLRGYTYLEE
jgi:arginine decarboxylase